MLGGHSTISSERLVVVCDEGARLFSIIRSGSDSDDRCHLIWQDVSPAYARWNMGVVYMMEAMRSRPLLPLHEF